MGDLRVQISVLAKVMLRLKDNHSMKESYIDPESPYIEILENRACIVNFQKRYFTNKTAQKCSWRAVLKQYYEIRDFLGFKFRVILNLYWIPFDAVVVIRTENDFLFKSDSTSDLS